MLLQALGKRMEMQQIEWDVPVQRFEFVFCSKPFHPSSLGGPACKNFSPQARWAKPASCQPQGGP